MGVAFVPRASAAARGRPAPAVEMVTFSGEAFGLRSLEGRPLLMIFWAPWCKGYQREPPLLADFYRSNKPARLCVTSFGFAEPRGHVEEFVRERPKTVVFPAPYAEDRWMADPFKLAGTLTSVLPGRRGNILPVHRGGGLPQYVELQEFLAGIKEDEPHRGGRCSVRLNLH